MARSLQAEMAERLLSGEEGADVVAAMRAHPTAFKTECSLQSFISRIRRLVLESDDPRSRHPGSAASLAALARRVRRPDVDPECRAKAAAFLQAGHREQHQLHRRHARRQFCMGHPEVDAAVRAVRLLPANLASFRATADETDECRRRGAQATVRQNESVLVLHGASGYLDRAVAILEQCTASTSFGALGFALLLVSGRRTAELFNGQSAFARGPIAQSARFRGQLKRRQPRPYDVPLLCPFELFQRGLRVLREKQAGEPPGDNAAANRRYAANLSRSIKRDFLVPQARVHDCRRFYIQAVWLGFRYDETPVTFNVVAMQFLGHATLAESLHYNSVRLLGFTHRFAGPRLPVAAVLE